MVVNMPMLSAPQNEKANRETIISVFQTATCLLLHISHASSQETYRVVGT